MYVCKCVCMYMYMCVYGCILPLLSTQSKVMYNQIKSYFLAKRTPALPACLLSVFFGTQNHGKLYYPTRGNCGFIHLSPQSAKTQDNHHKKTHREK